MRRVTTPLMFLFFVAPGVGVGVDLSMGQSVCAPEPEAVRVAPSAVPPGLVCEVGNPLCTSPDSAPPVPVHDVVHAPAGVLVGASWSSAPRALFVRHGDRSRLTLPAGYWRGLDRPPRA